MVVIIFGILGLTGGAGGPATGVEEKKEKNKYYYKYLNLRSNV